MEKAAFEKKAMEIVRLFSSCRVDETADFLPEEEHYMGQNDPGIYLKPIIFFGLRVGTYASITNRQGMLFINCWYVNDDGIRITVAHIQFGEEETAKHIAETMKRDFFPGYNQKMCQEIKRASGTMQAKKES